MLGDIYRCSAVWEAPGADGKMVFTAHFKTQEVQTPIGDFEEATEIAVEAFTTIDLLYLPFISDTFTLEEINVIGISNPLIGVTNPIGATGALAGDTLPLRSAPVAKLTTGLRGRSYNGRMFLLAPLESQQNGGTLTTAYQNALQVFIGGYRRFSQGASGNVYDMAIYSEVLSTAQGQPVANFVANWAVNNTLGSQRGRQRV